MPKLIKYEFIKIWNSRISSVVIALVLVISCCFSGYQIFKYKTGKVVSSINRSEYPSGIVSNKNIDSFREKIREFEDREEIYEKDSSVQNSYAGYVLKGKYDVKEDDLLKKALDGEITNEEYHKILSEYNSAPCIKEEYLSEYFALYYPISVYETAQRDMNVYFENFERTDYELNKRIDYSMNTYNIAEKLEKGIYYGYDYGWNVAEGVFTGVGILLIFVIIFGLCGVFSEEYRLGTDSLLLSTKKGKNKLATAKILTGIIYSLICTLGGALVSYLPSLIILGFEGGNVGYSITHFQHFTAKVISLFLACCVISMITLCFSAFFRKITTIIFCTALVNVSPAFLTYSIDLMNKIPFDTEVFLNTLPINILINSHQIFQQYATMIQGLFTIRTLYISLLVSVFLIILLSLLVKVLYLKHRIRN